jgi:subtilisin family serine protease
MAREVTVGLLVGLLELVKLAPLMRLTQGRPEIAIGLIDGPVNIGHPGFGTARFREVAGNGGGCLRNGSEACTHGTLVAGVLAAKRGTAVPAICPGCTFLVRPIFREAASANGATMATPEAMATAVIDVVDAGARAVNLSVGLINPSPRGVAELNGSLDYAARRGVVCVVAAGNQGNVGGSVLTRHPWVIPVAGCDGVGRPTSESNLGSAIGLRGLRAPGIGVTSLRADGGLGSFGGTSAAAPFVTGTIALLLSLFPMASATQLRSVIANAAGAARRTVVPPLLDAWTAYQLLAAGGHARAAS